jgi:prophage DNA circulation protein
MSWKSRIRPASYKGAPFGVLEASGQGGRRTVTHEFPLRDEPIIEDLGRAARTFTVQGFLLGPTYMDQRDALIRVLEEPGPGSLVHPWYGEVTVSPSGLFQDRHTAADGGMCVVTMTFTRDAGDGAPAFSVNQMLRAFSKANIAGTLACGLFDAVFKVAGEAAWVVDQAWAAVDDALTFAAGSLGLDIEGGLSAITAVADHILPGLSLSQALWSSLIDIGSAAEATQAAGGSSGQDVTGGTQSRLASGWIATAARVNPVPDLTTLGATRTRIAVNAAAARSLVRHLALVEASKALVSAEPESRSQARDLRYAYQDAVDAVLLQESGETLPTIAGAPVDMLRDDLYVAVTTLRAVTLASLAQAAKNAPEVAVWTPASARPSLALCYAMSGGITLDADLIRRNRVVHPGFVPAARLEVLTDADV